MCYDSHVVKGGTSKEYSALYERAGRNIDGNRRFLEFIGLRRKQKIKLLIFRNVRGK